VSKWDSDSSEKHVGWAGLADWLISLGRMPVGGVGGWDWKKLSCRPTTFWSENDMCFARENAPRHVI
jgi:hypothetical protein